MILTLRPDSLVNGRPTDGASPPDLPPTESMRLIVHRCRVAALAAERVFYAPHIDVLEPDHPERRFVAALCLYSHAVDTDRTGHPYHQAEAEAFARALLMPPEAFAAVIAWSDPDLAELFTVPLDQVRQRRRDYLAAP